MGIDLSLTEENRLVQSTVRGFTAKEIEPHIREWDSNHETHAEVFTRMGELGFLGAPIPEEYGGSGLDYVSLGILCEELERADTAFRVVMSVHVGLNSLTLLQWGSEDQKQRYLAPQARGEKLAASDALKLFDAAIRPHGAVLLGGYWDLLSIGSTGECITKPQDLDRLAVRGPGKAYDMLYAAQGSITVPQPSPEIPRALKTGAVDSVTTTLSSMTVGNGHKFLKCITDPTVAVPGMVYVATLMSVKSFEALPADRQKAVLEAGKQMSVRVQAEANKATSATLDRMRADGVKVVAMSPEDVAAWRAAAEQSAWAQFRKASPAADQMITAAAAAVARQ